MRTRLVLAGALAATIATLGTRPLHAQRASGPSYQLTPYAGYMFFGDMLRGPLGTTLSNADGMVYGAQVGVKLTDNIALVGNVARASSDMKVGLPLLGGLSVGSSALWLYDGGVQLTMPSGVLPIAPFAQVGAGAIRYDIQSGPLKTASTSLAYNAGLGADLSLGRSLGLRLMAKDYIGKFDVKEATQLDVNTERTHNWALSAGLRLGF